MYSISLLLPMSSLENMKSCLSEDMLGKTFLMDDREAGYMNTKW